MTSTALKVPSLKGKVSADEWAARVDLAAAAIAIVGLLAMRWVGAFVARGLDRRTLDLPVRHLIVGAVRAAIFTLTLIAVLDKVGVQVAPLVAGLGTASAPRAS